MSVYITGGTLGFLARPADVRAVRAAIQPRLDAAPRAARAARDRVLPVAACRRSTSITTAVADFATLRPYAKPLGLLYMIVVLAHDDGDRVRDLRAGHADATRDDRRGGRRVGRGLPVRERRRRLLRRRRGRPLGPEAGHRAVAGRGDAVPGCRAVPARRRRSRSCWRSADSSCSRRCRSTSSSVSRSPRSAPRRSRR